MALEDVDTPALLLDLDAFERNLDRMAKAIEGKPVKLRPHSKSHKCAVIGLAQMERGAVGLCCQKSWGSGSHGCWRRPQCLVSNQIVGRPKLLRLAALSKQAEWVGVCADHPDNVTQLDEAAGAMGAALNVLVEIDTGAARCGVEPVSRQSNWLKRSILQQTFVSRVYKLIRDGRSMSEAMPSAKRRPMLASLLRKRRSRV